MIYRAIGLMSGSSLDGLDIAFVEFHEVSGKWTYDIIAATTYAYDENWSRQLSQAITLSGYEYQLLHTAFGHYCGDMVKRFIKEKGLEYKAQLIASHGHTTFHAPYLKMTSQLGDGAAIAASTGINVVSDLRAIDVALGGHGAPIVPIGERLLLQEHQLFLNLGGIANISCNIQNRHIGFDVCPANKVLNLLALHEGKAFDEGGKMASLGKRMPELLEVLNQLEYYGLPYPKSLANDFGTDVVYPLLRNSTHHTANALRTYIEHICIQVKNAVQKILESDGSTVNRILITGGGAHNTFLVQQLKNELDPAGIEVVLPSSDLIDFKEAVIMALIGVLRWREEYNVIASVTGATRDSIGGAVWIGQEA